MFRQITSESRELSPNGAVFLEVSTNLTKHHKSVQNFHSFRPGPKDKFSSSNSGTELYSPGNEGRFLEKLFSKELT